MNEHWYLREVVKRTYKPRTHQHIAFCIMGLAGEAGEVANLGQKLMRGDFTEEDLLAVGHPQREKLVGELGGVMWFLQALMWRLDISPNDVRKLNGDKLLSRLERGAIHGDGDDR